MLIQSLFLFCLSFQNGIRFIKCAEAPVCNELWKFRVWIAESFAVFFQDYPIFVKELSGNNLCRWRRINFHMQGEGVKRTGRTLIDDNAAYGNLDKSDAQVIFWQFLKRIFLNSAVLCTRQEASSTASRRNCFCVWNFVGCCGDCSCAWNPAVCCIQLPVLSGYPSFPVPAVLGGIPYPWSGFW